MIAKLVWIMINVHASEFVFVNIGLKTVQSRQKIILNSHKNIFRELIAIWITFLRKKNTFQDDEKSSIWKHTKWKRRKFVSANFPQIFPFSFLHLQQEWEMIANCVSFLPISSDVVFLCFQVTKESLRPNRISKRESSAW